MRSGQTNQKVISDVSSATSRLPYRREPHAMTDAAGQKDRPGAGSHSLEMTVEGIPLNCYLNHHPKSGRVEIVRIMPQGVPDEVVKSFPDEDSAWAWVRNEFRLRRLP